MHGQYVAATHNKLTRAVAVRANGRARTGSHFQRAKLIMVTGDLLEAVALGTQALDWAGPCAQPESSTNSVTSTASPNPTSTSPK